jgi:hypothetical protein
MAILLPFRLSSKRERLGAYAAFQMKAVEHISRFPSRTIMHSALKKPQFVASAAKRFDFIFSLWHVMTQSDS